MARPILTATLALVPLACLALSACQLRSDADEAAPSDPMSSASPAPSPAASQTPDGISIIRDEVRGEEPVVLVSPLAMSVPFTDGGIDLAPAALDVLRDVVDSAAMREGWPVILRGHTDSAGNDSANLRASRARAEAVAAWLVEHGVDDARITVIAFGEQNPVAPNARPDGSPDEAGRARNRRVDIEIAPPRETAVDGRPVPDEGA